MEEAIFCNKSSSVKIKCIAYSENVLFSSWMHSYNDQFIRNISGVHLNNGSTIAIHNCDFKDSGVYTCAAWHDVENESYWSNVTTYLTVYGKL